MTTSRALAICDRCGLRYKAKDRLREWTGLWVCTQCYEDKHPQLTPYVGDLSDPTPVPNARPETALAAPDNTAFDTQFPQTAGSRA